MPHYDMMIAPTGHDLPDQRGKEWKFCQYRSPRGEWTQIRTGLTEAEARQLQEDTRRERYGHLDDATNQG